MADYLKITQDDLKKSAVQYRKELLILPLQAAKGTLDHMTAMPGVAGRQVLGELSGDAELGPYDATRVDETGVSITARELETHLGSLIKRFDVNSAAKTAWGSIHSQGEELGKEAIALAVLRMLSKKLSAKLEQAIWSGKRNPSGTATLDLFDGFDTITEQDVTAGSIAATKNNYFEFSAPITRANAFDVLHEFYQSADQNLQDEKTKLFVSYDIYNAYSAAALDRLGAVSYNTDYRKTTLLCSGGLCELIPVPAKKNSKFIHLSTKENLIYGFGDGMADEKLTIEKVHELLLSFVATMYFGVQFETVAAQKMYVGKLHD